jgi:BlaI family transcriptional regulator, penicillinase repressor
MKITAAESQIMEVLWRSDQPLAVDDVREALTDETWTDATIRTLLSRLVGKRAVSASKDGRRFLYCPLVVRADYVHAESRSLIDRLFDGQIEPFVAHFSQRVDLSSEEIARLRTLVERLERDK